MFCEQSRLLVWTDRFYLLHFVKFQSALFQKDFQNSLEKFQGCQLHIALRFPPLRAYERGYPGEYLIPQNGIRTS